MAELRIMLEREDAALDRVDDNVATLEERVHRPRPVECRLPTNLVILGPDIKEAYLLKQRTAVVLVNRGDVHDTEPRAVVGLVREALDDILVVVDGPLRALVDTAEDGVCQVLDVNDVRGRVLVLCRACLLLLVEFVVKEKVLVVGRQPAP